LPSLYRKERLDNIASRSNSDSGCVQIVYEACMAASLMLRVILDEGKSKPISSRNRFIG
jgi:hypothetical protein